MIKNVNFKTKVTLLQFLLSTILPHWKHSEESDERWLRIILNDHNVVIVFDGLDAAAVDDLTIVAPAVNVHNPTEPFYLLLNLISGKMLPYARIIVTSRPNQFYRLHYKQTQVCGGNTWFERKSPR